MATMTSAFGGPSNAFGAPAQRHSSGFNNGPQASNPQAILNQSPMLRQYIDILSQILQNPSPDKLDEIMFFDPSEILQKNHLMQLRHELQSIKSVPLLQKDGYMPLFKKILPDFAKSENLPFAAAGMAYLTYLRDVELDRIVRKEMGVLKEFAEKGLKQVVDKILQAINAVCGGATFIPPMKKSLRLLVNTTIYIDRMENRREDQAYSTTALSTVLLALNYCLRERSAELGRRAGALPAVNLIFKLYKQLEKDGQIDTIINQVKGSRLLSYQLLLPKSERVTYHFTYGRHCLNVANNFTAYEELSKAYYMCHPKMLWHRREIMKYLIPAGLTVGIFPSSTMLQRTEAAGFADIFLPLCAAIKRGDFRLLRTTLFKYKRIYTDLKIYGYLNLRLESQVWRNFIRSYSEVQNTVILSLTTLTDLINWQLSSIPPPARSITDHIPFTLVDVENLCAGLLEKGFLRGTIVEQQADTKLMLSKRNGFLPIFDIYEGWAEEERREEEKRGGGRGGLVRLSGVKAIS